MGGSIRFSGKVITGIIQISQIIRCDGMEGAAPGGVMIPLIHFGDAGMVPTQGYSAFDHGTIEIRVSDKDVFAGTVSMRCIVTHHHINSAHSCHRRRTNLRGGPDELVVCGGIPYRGGNCVWITGDLLDLIEESGRSPQKGIRSNQCLQIRIGIKIGMPGVKRFGRYWIHCESGKSFMIRRGCDFVVADQVATGIQMSIKHSSGTGGGSSAMISDEIAGILGIWDHSNGNPVVTSDHVVVIILHQGCGGLGECIGRSLTRW
ncbi:hypothetical protein DSECCO2_525730 [anaerobic digester metagenome]